MICAIWGQEKTWKTTMALSWPRPLRHMDLDVGGFDRASWRISVDGIKSTSYPTPIQMEKLLGINTTGPSIRFPKKVIGIKEVWQKFVQDFVAAVQDQSVATVVIDSATQLWNICHRAHLQELQERQIAKNPRIDENELREALMPKEYGEPNERMRSVIYTARSFSKHLVLTHYPRDVYAQRVGERGVEEYKTGEFEIDGFKDTQKLVDIIVMLEIKKDNKVTAKITRCGLESLGTEATGLLIEPSYEGIIKLQRAMSGKET